MAKSSRNSDVQKGFESGKNKSSYKAFIKKGMIKFMKDDKANQ